MAGIVGYIGESILRDDPTLINRMIKEIKYVESDAVDLWNSDNLSIARVHHGVVNPEKQPIFNEDNSLLIFMDGEVYDYEAEKMFLINKGHRFKYKQNDAEFCLHLYEELGEESFTKLNGSFLIAIYDLYKKELLLVNDRFSSFPLFYYGAGEYLIFGSQLKAILQCNQVPRNLDLDSIMEFFTFYRVLGTKTYYQEIKVMFPAIILRFKNGRFFLKHYWEMNYREDGRKSKEYYIEALENALKNAVKRRTKANRRYGIFLSGGLDSRGVLAASECPLEAFTIGTYKNFEAEIAEKVAKIKGIRFSFIQQNLDYYVNIVHKAVELGDGMNSFQHGHFIGFMDSVIKKCDTIFTGHALDVLFKSFYLPHKNIHIFGKKISLPKLYPLSNRTISTGVLEGYKNSTWIRNPSSLFANDLSVNFVKVLERSVHDIIRESNRHAFNPYNKYDYFVYCHPYKHLTYLNVLCIQHYMEQRVIMFDNDLIDLYLEIPPELRFNGRIYRKALATLNRKLFQIPNASTGLPPLIPEYMEFGINLLQKATNKFIKPRLPHPSYNRRSWPNMPELIRHNDKLKQLILNVINDDKYISPSIFNRVRLMELFNSHMRNQEDFTDFLFLVLTFGIWYKKYGPA